MRWFVLILIINCSLLSALQAQVRDYQLRLFDFNTGIEPGAVNKVAKDSRGYLWLLYRRQVQRFDGQHLNSFRPLDFFDNLLCDAKERVWVSAPNQIAVFINEQDSFQTVHCDGLLKDEITGPVIEMPDQRILLLTSQRLFQYHEASRQFKPLSLKITPPSAYSLPLAVSSGQHVYYAIERMVCRVDLTTGKTDSLPAPTVKQLFVVSSDSLIVTSWDNTSYWFDYRSRQTASIKLPAHLVKDNDAQLVVRSVIRYTNTNRYLFACSAGIYEYDAANHTLTAPLFAWNGRVVATSDYANTLYMDKDGYVWMATIDGLARFSPFYSAIKLVRMRQLYGNLQAGIDNVRRITQDKEGNLWLATGYGFAKWKKGSLDFKVYAPVRNRKDGLSHPSIRGLVYDGKNLILGPTDKGLWIFNPETETYKRPRYADAATERLILTDFIDDICPLYNGDYLVMGKYTIYLLKAHTYQLSRVPVKASLENSNYAIQGGDKMIWVLTNKGLHCLDSALQDKGKAELPMKRQAIHSTLMLKDNRLLFSTEDGLFTALYERGKIQVKRFSHIADGLYLTNLYLDKQGRIWATSNNGLVRFDTVGTRIERFDFSDNLQGYAFNTNSWYLNKEGLLYMGGTNGINYWNPESFVSHSEKLNVHFRYTRFGEKASPFYTFLQTPSLPYRTPVEVFFNAVYYENPEKIKYRYLLDGLDKEWQQIGNSNQLRFTSLSPGNYRLRIQASLNGVNWVNAHEVLSFEILPAFWMTWWFISLLILTTAALIAYFFYRRNSLLRLKQEELEAEQAINYFAASIYETNSVHAILWDVAKNCIGRLHFEDCVIYLIDYGRNMLVQKAAHGPKNPESWEIENPIEIPLGKGITGAVAQSGKAEIIPDTSKDPRYIADVYQGSSEITVPIVSNGIVWGVIDCEHSKKGFFTQKHLSILKTIASLCANKIVKAKAEAEKAKTEAILMDTKQKMAEAEMQALRAQMNPHFIFNCLNSINRYIVKSDHKTASLYLTRFAKLIRLILDNSNTKSITLHNELEALRLYVEMESIRFEKKFHYTIAVADNIQQDSVYLPPLIIQPYVENAIWHGLLHMESAGELRITIYKESEYLLKCIIEDNGIGREKAKELKSKSVSQKKSLGMRLTEDRLALLNKGQDATLAVVIEDLKTDEGQASGTKVVLRIPIDN
jgi:ligand-binding sensor domain-containing protein/putative methionine-R-sulfoxide reductase with GAF domain